VSAERSAALGQVADAFEQVGLAWADRAGGLYSADLVEAMVLAAERLRGAAMELAPAEAPRDGVAEALAGVRTMEVVDDRSG
jgi:uncharacterized protein with von Willebrand factor type A (vWA) domain